MLFPIFNPFPTVPPHSLVLTASKPPLCLDIAVQLHIFVKDFDENKAKQEKSVSPFGVKIII